MKKRFLRAGLYLAVVALAVMLAPGYDKIAEKVEGMVNADVILIDPGHGGIDGGAVSSSGVSEKAINLAIAQEVKKLAESVGWQVVMTREADTGLYEEGSGAIRSLKTQDLRARRSLIEETGPALAISIHLNSFTEDSSVKGMQVFYPGTGGTDKMLKNSKKLAETLQEQVGILLDNSRKRTALPKQDVYLFKKVTCPIAIIECGFLSNPQEAELLQDRAYQAKLARGILQSITKFTGKKPPKKLKILDSEQKRTNSER